MSRPTVLFLCTGNSARSQMGEALLRDLAGDRFESLSAGLDPKGVHPLTVAVLNELGLDVSGATSKDVRELMKTRSFETLITVCDHADANCPAGLPGVKTHLRWSFKDPAAATGTDEQKLAVFREIRNQIKARISDWLEHA